ncbi:MAG: hypothetical protein SGBAC_009170 [Bacillariaceae sp.]
MGKKSKKKKCSGSTHNKVTNKSSRSEFGPFKIGQLVIIQGLKKATRFNEKAGTFVALPQDDLDSRYGVSVDGHKLAVQTSNLEAFIDFEEQLHAESKKRNMDVDSMTAKRKMLDMIMTEEMQIKMYGRKIKPMPDYCSELRADGGGFPKGVSPKWANTYLRTFFETDCSLPHTLEAYFKSPDYQPSHTDFLKRIGTNFPSKTNWFGQRRVIGDIFPHMAHPYSANIRHSYSNQTYRKELLHLGTTHVAVGFVDLGILLEADLQGPFKEGMSGTASSEIRNASVVCATWEEETEANVKQALSNLCESEEKRHPKVEALLRHWRDAGKMSLQNARSHWQSRSDSWLSSIAHFERKQDRIDLAKYELTGDFGLKQNGKPTYGNIIMLDCPEGTASLSRNETVFSCLNWEALASSLSFPNTSVFEAAQEYIMERLLKVAGWASHGTVTLKLVCDDVQNMTDIIAASKPWTMSWSNVLDYMEYADFHRLARACSINGNTLHFGYSMNWTVDVFGVNILDFAQKEHAEFREKVITEANQSVATIYKMAGWDKYLRLPPPSNPINTTSIFLEMGQYKNWKENFFRIGRRQGPCKVGNIEHNLGSPMSHTGSSTVYFTWTYDPNLEMNGIV